MNKKLVCLIVLLGFMCFYSYSQVNKKDAANTKNIQPVEAGSLEQLVEIIASALADGDTPWLEQIKEKNKQLVRENRLLTMQWCSTLLDYAIKNELSGQNEKGTNFYRAVEILADIYSKAADSTYLLDKAAIFRQWDKEEKQKYQNVEELYWQGEGFRKEYKYDKVIDCCNKSLTLYREIGYKEGEANCLRSLGEVHQMLADYEKAGQQYEQALVIYREIKDRLGEANCLQCLGDAYRMLADYEKAGGQYERALVICQEIKDRLGEANCLKSLGDVHYSLDNYEKAGQQYEQALVIYREIKDLLGEANCLQSLGDVHRMLDDYEKAEQQYDQALDIYREIKDLLGEANCLQSLGDVHLRLAAYEKAGQEYEQALVIFQEVKDRLGEANCLQSLGDVYRMLADYEKAGQQYEQALEIYREIKARLGEANCLQSLGAVHYILDNYEKAGQQYDQALEIYREIKARLGEANCLKSLGDVHYSLDNYEKAGQQYDQALVIYREIKDRLGEANCLQSLGDVHRMLSDYEKAGQQYDQALVIHREIKDRLGEANCLRSLGDLHYRLNNYEKAGQQYDQALAIYKVINSRLGMLLTYFRLGQTYETAKNYPNAEQNYLESINMLEEIWNLMKTEDIKTLYMGSNIFPYQAVIKLLFNSERGPDAFPYAERSKARSFLYLLGNKRINPKKGLHLSLVKIEEELRQKMALLSMKIHDIEKRALNKRDSTGNLTEEFLRLKQQHGEILAEMRRNCSEYASFVSVNPLPVQEIQTLIANDGNTVLLEFYTTHEAAYLWLLDGKSIHAQKIDITQADLNKKILDFHTMVSNITFGVETLEARASELYDLLLKPALRDVKGKSTILLVPHGILHYLPFEALMTNGKFVMEQDLEIVYLPSASVYKYCRDKNRFKKEQFIAFGNPDGTLPFSGKEIQELKELYPKDTEIFKGEEAKESRLKRDYAPLPDILHFACHGGFNAGSPMYSALMLTPDTNDDGRLEVHEIYGLELKPAYLVTLSACETNLGGIAPGDELIGLTRAFIYAGTSAILASLWKVDDYYTEKFMAAFYRALKTGSKIEALQTARKVMMAEYKKRHPFYWSAFVLIGDPR